MKKYNVYWNKFAKKTEVIINVDDMGIVGEFWIVVDWA